MVPFTIWSSQHSPQTLLMLYRRTAGMTSTAGCATARARCSAVSSAPGCTMPSASNYQLSPRATGSVQSVRYHAEDMCMCVGVHKWLWNSRHNLACLVDEKGCQIMCNEQLQPEGRNKWVKSPTLVWDWSKISLLALKDTWCDTPASVTDCSHCKFSRWGGLSFNSLNFRKFTMHLSIGTIVNICTS